MIEGIFDGLGVSEYFSAIDLSTGSWNVLMCYCRREKTTFLLVTIQTRSSQCFLGCEIPA